MKKILLLFICAQIIAQEALNETIVFESRNPFSFEEIITDLDNQETQTVTGILGFPADFDAEKKISPYCWGCWKLKLGSSSLKIFRNVSLIRVCYVSITKF